MSYLRFEKAVMTNLEESLRRELLRTNRSGAYACSTVVDCNTRKYHGLLVVPVPELDDDNHVLLSSLDVTVIQHGAEFNLGLHKYQGNNYSPKGHKYIREFDCDKVPTTLYRVGGVVLKKEVVFQHYEDRILLRYTLVDAHSATTLRFRPFMAFRSVRQFTHENSTASRAYEQVDNGISACMYAGYPNLYMQFSKKNEFVFQPDWYRGIEYPKEQERGYASNEDLYVPGYFEMPIKKGESIVFSASTSEIKTSGLKKLFDTEVESRAPRDNFFHCLVNAAHQFHIREKNDDRYLIAGYPWFKCRARDTFISLPGLTLAIDEQDYFELVMQTASKALREFMNGKPQSGKIYEIEQPDVPLWAVWSIQQYAKFAGRDKCSAMYGKLLEEIIHYIIDGKHPNLRLDDNGLLYSNGRDKAVTWMNSTAYGRPVVPRSGYIVEFNALWYNALKFCASISAENGREKEAAELEDLAKTCGESFVDTFLNEYGYLFDYVDGNMMDWSVRPNMIFAVALDYSPLSKEQKRSVLDVCTRELLTPKGLRSLSPKSGGYNPMYVGPQTQRDYAYHQGTAWPWLGGFYMEACLKLYKNTRLSFIERQMVGYEDEMNYHALGSISELFDGNPPFHGRGGMSFAMNVAEVLRSIKLLAMQYTYQK
ncbi:MAG: glycogen debranching enzyme N-terminal domain-containing protein [Prevotellaceae bacterium]|nr:glycogen debranching enzyme N-terminal domain-containing protein [Prevotellaceae bacterium]MDD5991387.1 glycogen debranching enzyme N-terminal domain-containing protein [Prevotellaceae bacterium]MDD6008317.1 glycogen debranching enzyme N-terminal domain-containing protein [Prevotellaceae bacterium]MDD6112337.1 glycogen debranching enzyme N-terminal domain-containing protein [Prevotellaceae bacterium]MDD6780127.1 glycogen debranching enzyme N-terminal domain-containing protein [Prevotellaceae